MQNRSEPCIWNKYPCQSGTDRQKLELLHIFMRCVQVGRQCVRTMKSGIER